MINEFLEIFKKVYEKHGDQYVIDEYIPKDGTYILVDYNTWNIESKVEIKYDKKKKEIIGESNKDFSFIAACDYYSNLLDMNKPMDPKKVIHSNQLYAFFIKKNVIHEKLTKEILEGYKGNIFDPKQKYKVKESLEIYESVEKELPKINTVLGEEIFKWINGNIYSFVDKNTKESDYLKIFFIEEDRERSLQKFKEEYKRYVVPNIFNSNSYNLRINNVIYGLSNNNMGLNAKKTYLENKTRKVKAPYLVASDEILLQKSLYDYLFILAKKGKNFVYCTPKKIEGRTQEEAPPSLASCLLKISYAKEVEVRSFEIISSLKKEEFSLFFEEVIPIGEVPTKEIKYGTLDWKGIRDSCNTIFFNGIFSKSLMYFDDELDIRDSQLKKIMRNYRDGFYRWLYLGDDTQIRKKSKDLLLDSILFSIKNGYGIKMKHQINLWLSLENYLNKGGNVVENFKRTSEIFLNHVRTKEDWNFESDEEYAYAIGQFLSFLNFKRNTKNKDATFLREILFVSNNSILKDRITRLYSRNLHNISTTNRKLSKTISNIMEYQGTCEMKEVSQYIIAGFSNTIAFFDKEGKENETNE